MIEWGQKSKPPDSPDQNLTPKNSHAKFPIHKNFQKVLNNMWPFTRKRSLRLAVRKPFFSRSNGLRYRSNGSSYPFKTICQPFKRRELSALKKDSSAFRVNGWSYPVQKNLSTIRTARAIHSKKFVSRSNGTSYPLTKIRKPFERFELSRSKKSRQPFQLPLRK